MLHIKNKTSLNQTKGSRGWHYQYRPGQEYAGIVSSHELAGLSLPSLVL